VGFVDRLNSALGVAGLSPRTAYRNARGMAPYLRNKRELEAQARTSGGEFPFGKLYPCLGDRYEAGGSAGGHYFHQDLYVAQLIHRNTPERHVDVASRVDGFVAHVAAFMPVEVMDIRPVRTSARNIAFRQMDLMAKPFTLNGYTASLSCLHALEHFGLGRYGDDVDYYGHMAAWENLTSMVTTGGRLYFSVPIGPQRIEFDGHRVFSIPYLMEMMILPSFEVASFAYVDDAGEMNFDADLTAPAAAEGFGNRMACGIFELVKRS
jgi:hypothetical protein